MVLVPIKPEELHHLNGRAMTLQMGVDGIAKHLAGAQGARFFDVLAGDPAATDEDLVLLSEFFQGLGVLAQARCVAACQDGAAERIDEYHEGGLAGRGDKRIACDQIRFSPGLPGHGVSFLLIKYLI